MMERQEGQQQPPRRSTRPLRRGPYPSANNSQMSNSNRYTQQQRPYYQQRNEYMGTTTTTTAQQQQRNDRVPNASIRSSYAKQGTTTSTSKPYQHSQRASSHAAGPSKSDHHKKKRKTISYNAERVVGTGSFGVVYLAKVEETDEVVAIKKVLQDRRYKNRELQMMKTVNHRNVVKMKHCFFNKGERNGLYLHLVLEYVPDTVYNFCKSFTKKKQYMPLIYVKLFTYQMLRSLNYIHTKSICHRDIKPQNLLVDPVSGVLKLCDFGSAKQLQQGEPNVAYICSRFYRAPELIFGSTFYTTAIDVWSAGCVLGELLLGEPLFPGESSLDQIVEIMRVLGKPKPEQLGSLSKNYASFKFPNVKALPWRKIYEKRLNLGFPLPQDALQFLDRMLCYDPRKRPGAIDLLADPFFDDLRNKNSRLPSGKQLPELFDFSMDELKLLSHQYSKNDLIPAWYRQAAS